MFTVVGLGNPGDEYVQTRHNVGRMVLERFVKEQKLPPWEQSSAYNALVTSGKVGAAKILCMMPETYMNKSGSAVKKVITSAKKAEKLVVIYDDIDLPLGAMKIAHGRGSGGHRGMESIIKGVGTKNFIRIRIGVSPTTPSGKLKKPKGEQKVLDFLLGSFKKSESQVLTKIVKKAAAAIDTITTDGAVIAMNIYN